MRFQLNLNEILNILIKLNIICLTLYSIVYSNDSNQWESKGIYAKKEHSLTKPYQGLDRHSFIKYFYYF